QGAESLMVILDTILHKCPPAGVEEICMGMSHRGRLNVLANFLKKSLRVIFTEFSENYIPELVAGDGDVKYHLGYRTVRKLASGAEVEIRLSANPSHLEAVDPVVEGTARARQRIRGDTEHRRKVLQLLCRVDAAFTQPDLYAKIDKHPSVAQLYKRELLESGALTEDDAASLETEMDLRLEMALDNVKAIEKEKIDKQAKFKESTAVFQPEYKSSPVATAINEKTLKAIVDALTRVPDDFNIQPKIKRIIIEHRRKVFENGGPFEWHYAELLAFGSLLLEGTPVRLSGQDSARGTFSSRHALLYDAKSGAPYVPLMHLG